MVRGTRRRSERRHAMRQSTLRGSCCVKRKNHLDDVENFTGRLLHLPHLMHEIPELRGTGHLVRREHLHAVHRRVRLLLSGGLAAYHLVLAHRNHLLQMIQEEQSGNTKRTSVDSLERLELGPHS